AGAVNISVNRVPPLLETMQDRELVTMHNGDFHLTDHGREYALHMIRAHRLWESYLADTTGYGESDWHGQAEAIEHTLAPQDVDALAARLGNPMIDPHGDPIPTAAGEYVPHGGHPLSGVQAGETVRIVHLEDEPDMVYAQLVADGLYLDQIIQVLENDPQRVRFWADGHEHTLAPLVAANVSVLPLPPEVSTDIAPAQRLDGLQEGEQANITAISRACRGAERRRLMDLGIVPGTQVTVEMHSPSGDPTAYRIRDTIIALRREQARHIRIERAEA
ncbi:MAG: metal-dependent transcriptional regulator, partial [Caldilineaceae bacterium]|nr:metal-dependent transcriptional regulator [Caldilineaceae bacterium]